MNEERKKLMFGKLTDELSPEQIDQFNLLISHDENFRKEFEFFKEVSVNMQDKKVIDLRLKLDKLYQSAYQPTYATKRISILTKNWFVAAASVAILITVGAIWLSTVNQKGWSDELYNSYYQTDEVYVNTRSKANFDVDVLRTGMELLEAKNFNAAIVEFNKLPNSVTANYYAGVAYMEINKHDIAIYKFDLVISDYLNLFYEQAQWYKGLCLVKLEKRDLAINQFNAIADSESYFKDKAKQVLVSLKKN